MKTNKHSILHYSLFAALIGIIPVAAFSAIRVGNHSRSYADAYNQVNAQVATARDTSGEISTGAPAAAVVDNMMGTPNQTGTDVAADEPVSAVSQQMKRCSMIYPTGEFDWARPTLGLGAGGGATCVAVVELRGYQMGQNGEDIVLARANLAAGDSVRCNISDFPENTHNNSISGNITVPADNPPTIEDVERVMNEEQKKNAGLKIAAGAVLMGLAGNAAGANEPGQDSLFGTGKSKMQATLGGVVAGGALMAGSSYAGKVAGDMILSTGVNAVAGSLIGNLAATGDSVLRIEDCEIDGAKTSCLWGMLTVTTPLKGEIAFYNIATQETYVCDANAQNCKPEELASIKLAAYPDKNIDEVAEQNFEQIVADPANQYFMSTDASGNISFGQVNTNQSAEDDDATNSDATSFDTDKGVFAKVSSGSRVNRRITAMIPGVQDKAFGMKQSDWREWKRNHQGATIYGRGANGTAYELPDADKEHADINNFYPMLVDAADGGVIDYSNKARLKATLIGAGAGGAMGAFVGYQGARDDIENRWVTAVREYNDSLTKVYCATGTRYLGQYNDTIYIPSMSGDTE